MLRTNTILVADGDENVLRGVKALLASDGYDVRTTKDFDEAKRALREGGVELIIAGVRMGAYNGLHLALRSRVGQPRRPVIITHDSRDSWYQREALECGAQFVVDPVHNPELRELVHSLVAAPSHAFPK